MKEEKYSRGDMEDISSSSKSFEYEDVVSSSQREPQNDSGMIKFSTFSDYASDTTHYRKKKHGLPRLLAAVGGSIAAWWLGMKVGARAAVISLVSIILVLSILLVGAFSIFDYDYNPISKNPEDLGILDGQIDEDVINIALFGIDTRGENTFTGNSDSIMILSLNTVTKKVKIISIVRDTLVRIEDANGKVSYNKINSAYLKGGPELAVKTLNQNFGLDIMKYATVNFYGMAEIIDAVGGIEATLTNDEVNRYPMNNINFCIKEICANKGIKPDKHLIKKTGTQHLNGIQAVSYARIRMGKNVWGTNDDFGRSDRQRYVMEQLFNKAKAMKATQYLPFAEALCPYTQTNYKPTEIASLATNILLNNPQFEQYRLPETASGKSFLMTSPQGKFGSVVYFDLAYAQRALHAIIYDDMTMDAFIEKNPVEKNDWYGDIIGEDTQKPKPQTPVNPEPDNDDDEPDDTQNPDNTEKPDGDDTQNPDGDDAQNPDGDTEKTDDEDTQNPSGGGTTQEPSGGGTTPPTQGEENNEG